MMTSRLFSAASGWAVALLTAAVILWSGVSNPAHNWDLVGYVAAALSRDGLSGRALTEATYASVRSEVSPDRYATIVSAPYAKTVHDDPESLRQQIPFYSIRTAYVSLIRWLELPGQSYARRTYLISAFFAALSVLMLAALATAIGAPLLAVPFVAVGLGLPELARLSTPDALACFSSLLAAWLLVRRSPGLHVAILLLPLARTDFVIHALTLALAAAWRDRRAGWVLSGCLSVLVCMAVNREAGHYGWLTVFNFTLIAITPYPQGMPLSTNVHDYLLPYLASVHDLVRHAHAVVYAMALCMLVKRRGPAGGALDDPSILAATSLAFVVLHLLLFPAYMDRFFVFAACLTALALLSMLAKRPDAELA